MAYVRYGYENIEYMEEENIKEVTLTSGRTSNMENKN